MKALREWVARHPAKAGTLAGWFQQFASGITTLTIIPLITHRLSPEEAGLWFSFQSLAMVVTLTDFGVGFAVARQVAFSLGGGSRREGHDFLHIRSGWDGIGDLDAAMRVIFRRMVLVATGLLILIHEAILPFTRLATERSATSTGTWYLLGSSAILLIFVKRYQSFLEGMGKIHLCRMLAGLYQFIAGVAAIGALLATNQLVWMALAVASATALYGAILRSAFRRTAAAHGESADQPPAGLVKDLWKVATPMGIVGVAGYCVTAIQVPLIAFILGPALVPPFYAAQKIGQMLNVAVSQLTGPQLPLFTMEYAAASWPAAHGRLTRTVAITLLLSAFVNLAYFFGSPYVAEWWLGPGRYPDAWTLGWLSLDYFLTAASVVLGQFVLASGVNPFMWSTLAMGLLNLLSCAVLGHTFGLRGIAASGLIAGLMTNYWLQIWCGFRLWRKLQAPTPAA